VADLPIPERSIAMLPTGAPALSREEALELLDQLEGALHELRMLKAKHGLTNPP
jgi:ribosomal protein L29